MRRTEALLFAVLAVSGCVTAAEQGVETTRAKGRPIQLIVAKLGPANSEERTSNGSVYTWTAQHAVPWTPQRTTTIQYVNGVPNEVGTLTESGQPQIQTCTFRAFVDAAGIVTSATAEGSRAACHTFDEKLSGTP